MAPTSERVCARYAPGHQVHFIQATLSNAGDWRPVELVSRQDSRAVVVIDDGVETWRFHDVESTRRLLAEWRPGASAFLSDRNLLNLAGGFLFPCRDAQWWVECHETQEPRQ